MLSDEGFMIGDLIVFPLMVTFRDKYKHGNVLFY